MRAKVARMVSPLTRVAVISYRCPRSHVALAATIHPQIEPRPDAPEGTIEGDVSEEEMLQRLEPGDLVICRVNAPLVPLAYALLRRGVPARVRGRYTATQR
jgi:hypothetical protein